MPDDVQRYSRYPIETKNVVERIRKIFKQNLYSKGTLANLFEPVPNDENGQAASR